MLRRRLSVKLFPTPSVPTRCFSVGGTGANGSPNENGCHYSLKKVFKENLKGGELYEYSYSLLKGMKLTHIACSPKIEKGDADDEDEGLLYRYGGFIGFFYNVMKENMKGGVLHELSFHWLKGVKLTPIRPPKGEVVVHKFWFRGLNFILTPIRLATEKESSVRDDHRC